jgi:branched-chain amino acid transport system ATP-binding protein
MKEVLKVINVEVDFGGVKALNGVSIKVKEGEMVGIIGPNGSGKSTLINTISGVFKPDKGEIWFYDQRIDKLRPEEIYKLGIVRSFQNPRLFKGLSVAENTMFSRKNQAGEKLVNVLFGKWRKEDKEIGKQASKILRSLNLIGVSNNWPSDISGGQMKLLEFSRALMGEPKLLLLDEPYAGISPSLAKEMSRTLSRINEEYGVAMVIVEHRIEYLFDIVKRVYAMGYGKVIAEGEPDKVINDKRVIEIYLGF